MYENQNAAAQLCSPTHETHTSKDAATEKLGVSATDTWVIKLLRGVCTLARGPAPASESIALFREENSGGNTQAKGNPKQM